MNSLAKIAAATLIVVLLNAESDAQQRKRGQQRNQNAQAMQQNQRQQGQRRGVGQSNQGQQSRGQNSRNGNGQGNAQGDQGTLSAPERMGLTLLREEEKLARDVYLSLGKTSRAQVFSNIAKSESQHMTAVANLLKRYQIPDPVTNDAVGAFSNPQFQRMYNSMVNSGSRSLVDALKVALKIEEMDIADLRVAINSTNQSDIKRVLQNLERGSRNHLRAFAAQLRNAGGTYVATHLSQTEFHAIANSTGQQGGNGGQQGNAGQGRGGNSNGNNAGGGKQRGASNSSRGQAGNRQGGNSMKGRGNKNGRGR